MGVLYILLGPPAVGKTSFSSALSTSLGSSPVVSFDSVANIVGVGGGTDLSYRQTRAIGEGTVESLLLSGTPSVVVEDTFHLRSLRKSFIRRLPPRTAVKWVYFVGELFVLLERNRKRATGVSGESLRKIFSVFQPPGSAISGDGVPLFERGNVVEFKEGMTAKDVIDDGSFWVKEEPGAASPPPPQPPQDVFDLTLRKFVTLSVSKDIKRARHANEVRKSILKLRKDDKSSGKVYGEEDAIRMWEEAKGDDVTSEYSKSIQTNSNTEPEPEPETEPEPEPSNPSDPNAFTPEETAAIIANLRTFGFDLSPSDLTSLILSKGGKSHKDWENTIACGEKMIECLGGIENVKKVFERTVVDGRWEEAVSAKPTSPDKAWVVLVTGLNGIRKSTSLAQPWIQDALVEALPDFKGDKSTLPCSSNSFFRQLDYMMCAVAADKFKSIYSIPDVETYSSEKAKIFSRYRMISEMLGAGLLLEAKKVGMNVMLETSGRDVAMYKYVDILFPDNSYNKLAINFEINDIKHAEKSVDLRMEREMKLGREVLGGGGSLKEITNVNMGGPYGSAVLAGVKSDSERVWKEVVEGRAGDVGKGWYLANIKIEGRDEGKWTAGAAGGKIKHEFV